MKFSGAGWREFEKGLNHYLKNKDTSVFTDNELFEIYDSIYSMGHYWIVAINKFSKEHPKSVKIESRSKTKRSKKYQGECFRLKKELHKPLDESIFSQAFTFAMK